MDSVTRGCTDSHRGTHTHQGHVHRLVQTCCLTAQTLVKQVLHTCTSQSPESQPLHSANTVLISKLQQSNISSLKHCLLEDVFKRKIPS